MKTRKALLILAAVAAGSTLHADKVTLEQTPKAVQQTIRSRAALRPIEDIDREIRNGQTTYEASWKDNAGQQNELLVSDQGQVLRDVAGGTARGSRKNWKNKAPSTNIAGFTDAQTAPLNWASESLQSKFKAMANGSEIQNFRKGKFEGRTAFEGTYTTNGVPVTVIMGEDGTLLASSQTGVAPRGIITTAPSTSTTASITGFANAQQAPMNWASETVQNKFKQMANGAEVQNFQKGQYNGRTAYLGTFSQNGQTTTVVMGEDGTVLTSVPNAVGAAPLSQSGTSR
jgi:hypothetical protein